MGSAATELRIIVIRDGEEKVNMTFPIYTLKHIQSLMPEVVLAKLKERDIDLAKILAKIEESGHQPQTIFEMSEPAKSYRVWIE